MINEFFKGSQDIPRDMFERTFKKLSEGVSTGYGSKLKDGVDAEMILQLKQNVKVFSAFKANKYKDEMISLLVDGDKKREWGDFLKEARKIDKDYNTNWLAAEYNLAIRQARGAEQWSTFNRDKDVYPNLQYMASRSANPRAAHKQYYGMILPIDHPFWSTGYPPINWGCKCWVKQTREPSTEFNEELPTPTNGLAGNAGKEKKVFTASSSYLRGVSKQDKNAIKDFLIQHKRLGFEEVVIPVGKNKIVIPIDADFKDLIQNTSYLVPFVSKYKRNWGIRSHVIDDNVKNPEYTDNKGNVGDLATAEKSALSGIKTAFKKLNKGEQLNGFDKVFLAIDLDNLLTKDNYFEFAKKLNGQWNQRDKLQYVMLKNGKRTCILEKNADFVTKITTIKKELL